MLEQEKSYISYQTQMPSGPSFFSKNKLVIIIGIAVLIILILGFLLYWFIFRQKPKVEILQETGGKQPAAVTAQPEKTDFTVTASTLEDLEKEIKERPIDKLGDEDGDGLQNQVEQNIFTDIYNPDSDGDKLDDYTEFILVGTDPLQRDTDKDGISDYDEIAAETDPLGTGKFSDKLKAIKQNFLKKIGQ